MGLTLEGWLQSPGSQAPTLPLSAKQVLVGGSGKQDQRSGREEKCTYLGVFEWQSCRNVKCEGQNKRNEGGPECLGPE